MTIKSPRNFLLTLTALLCLLPQLLAADDPPALAEKWLYTPYPGKAAELAEAIRAHGVFRGEHGDPRAWQVYTPVLGDDIGRIGVRFCCLEWADVDAYKSWQGQNVAVLKHYRETVLPLVEHAAHYFERMDWLNSDWNGDDGHYSLFAVTEFKLKVGAAAAFGAAKEKLSQIAKEQGWSGQGNSWAWATQVGGAPTELIIVPYRNYADIGAPREQFAQFLTTQLGAVAARELLQQMQEAVAETDYQIWEHRPELSMPE